jgi:hypothetical protein
LKNPVFLPLDFGKNFGRLWKGGGEIQGLARERERGTAEKKLWKTNLCTRKTLEKLWKPHPSLDGPSPSPSGRVRKECRGME